MVPYYPHPLAVAERALREFCNLWVSGLQPLLYLDTSPNGQIRVRSKVEAQVLHQLGPGPQVNLLLQCSTPSRQRRRVRRVRARAEAAAMAACDVAAEEAAVQVAIAAQAVPSSPSTEGTNAQTKATSDLSPSELKVVDDSITPVTKSTLPTTTPTTWSSRPPPSISTTSWPTLPSPMPTKWPCESHPPSQPCIGKCHPPTTPTHHSLLYPLL